MSAVVSRRTFLRTSVTATGGLLLSFGWDGPAPLGAQPATLQPNGFVRLAADGTVTIWSKNPDMGQGVKTALPMILAEEMDADWSRVQVRDAKGNRDRLVPLPQATLAVLRRFWLTHRHPELLFPNRSAGLKGAQRASSPLDRGGVQLTLRKVATACGLKKRSPLTVCATAMPRT